MHAYLMMAAWGFKSCLRQVQVSPINKYSNLILGNAISIGLYPRPGGLMHAHLMLAEWGFGPA